MRESNDDPARWADEANRRLQMREVALATISVLIALVVTHGPALAIGGAIGAGVAPLLTLRFYPGRIVRRARWHQFLETLVMCAIFIAIASRTPNKCPLPDRDRVQAEATSSDSK